jgi:hypothetical protein
LLTPFFSSEHLIQEKRIMLPARGAVVHDRVDAGIAGGERRLQATATLNIR